MSIIDPNYEPNDIEYLQSLLEQVIEYNELMMDRYKRGIISNKELEKYLNKVKNTLQKMQIHKNLSRN